MKTIRMKCVRLLAILLCIVMLFVFMPQSILAEAGELLGGNDPDTVLEEQKSEPAYVLGEMIDDRTSNTKTFRLSDGSFVLADYDKPVHFSGADGKWTDYDNTLKYIEDDEFVGYENTASDVLMRFAEAVNDKGLVNLHFGKYAIGMLLKDAVSGGKTEITNTAEAPEGNDIDSATTLTKYSSGVKYEDILADTDIQYILNGGNLKENIIVKERTGEYVYTFDLALEGLVAALTEDGCVLLNDDETGEAIFVIPAGYMYDANFECSDKVYYSVEEKDGVLTLTVIADAEWMEDEERAFPVTIDPSITGFSNRKDTYDVEVSNLPGYVSNNNNHTVYGGIIESSSVYYDHHILIRAAALPPIPASSVVVSASISLKPSNISSNGATLYVYPVTTAWDRTTVQWNTKPTYGNEALDYITLTSSQTSNFVSFDITEITRQWYAGTANNGVVIKNNSSSEGYVEFKSSDSSHTDYRPSFIIIYIDTKGVESSWTYSTQSAGSAGNGYVNGFNGNLVFIHNDISTKNATLPIAVSHVFNSAAANTEFYGYMNIGLGWRLSVEERVVPEEIGADTWYKYTDADGTDHYFYPAYSGATMFISEEGMGLTLTRNAGSTNALYVLSDEYGNTKSFNNYNNLSIIKDVSGNKNTFSYNSSRQLTSISYTPKNGNATTQLTFTYYSGTNGALKEIIDAYDSTNKITFKYSSTRAGTYTSEPNGYLREIVYSKGGGCSYEYNAAGQLITAKDSDTECCLQYSYYTHSYIIDDANNTQRTINKVHDVEEYGYDATLDTYNLGQAVSFKYEDKSFAVRTSGNDDIINNSDDIYTTYIFDNYGREICAYTSDLSGNDLYGTSYRQYTSMDIGSKTNNRISVESAKGTNAFNLLLNGNLESTSNWSGGVVNSSVYSSAITSTNKYCGNYSLKITSTDAVNGYLRKYQKVIIPEAGTYTLSAYVKTVGINALSNGGAYIALGNVESEHLTGSTNVNIQDGWQRISITAELTAGEHIINLKLANALGSAYFDCIQLEKGSAPSSYNHIQNGQMNLCNSWSESNYVNDSEHGYVNSIIGDAANSNYISQTIQLNTPKEKTLLLSGWGKASSASISGDRAFCMVANIYYTDNTDTIQTIDFNPAYSGWQYACAAIIPEKDVSYITVLLRYDHNINTAYFDDICLTIESAYTYTYDSNGNVISAIDALGNVSGATYTNVDLTHATTSIGDEYDYNYNDKHQVTQATKTAGNVVQTMTYGYDSYGNTTSCVLSATGVSPVMSSSAVYDSLGYLLSVVDSLGNTTDYSYNSITKLLKYVQNANGKRTGYLYDSRNRSTGVFDDADSDGALDSNEANVQYSYTNNRLTGITTGSTSYTLSYDSFGNMTQVKAGNNTLATYTYATGNGKLLRMTLGSGDYEDYIYDHLDRLITVKYNNTVTYTLTYDANGQIAKCVDSKANITHTYEYDSLGRLIRAWQTNSSGVKTLCVENLYDQYGRADKSTYVIGDKTLTYDVNYKANTNLVSSVSMPTSSVASALVYTYDGLDRLTKKDISFATHNDLFEEYSYYGYTSGGIQYTTPLVSTLTLKKDSTTTATYSYTYDSLGNITQVKENNVLKLSYEYDSLNQLVRENNAYANKTWKYTYDKAGNITGKYVYAYTTGTLPSTYQDHISYGYSTGAWGDMLTSYNGTTISYDTIGNPTNWRNGITNLTWNGRELNSFVKGSYTHSFKYNADGIRIEQTKWYTGSSLATIYHYVLDGTKIVSEYTTTSSSNTPSNVKYYYYDAAGSIAGLEYNGTTYYFQKNLQGDIIRICNLGGDTVVEYTYDAWGKVLSVTGSQASTLGQINPFRYRGYYYDSETGLYYLQTRYYDPEVGRFLNADGYIGANGDIPGYNMFAYCSNNPVMSCDPSGEGWLSDAWNSICDWVEDRVNDVVEAITVIVDGAINIIQNVKEDIEHFNWNNTDVDTVYNAHYFSAYKGQLVIRHSIPFLTSGAIAGTIFLNHSKDSQEFENRKDTLNHEWGHLQQEKELGILYIPMVAIPSVVYNIASRFDDDLANNYYNMPWERKADLFGGVNRGLHKPGSEIIANNYHNIGVTINSVFMTAISCMLGA